VAGVVGYRGEIKFDTSQPDGTPRKLLEASRISRLGWQPSIALRDGTDDTYARYLAHREAEAATVMNSTAGLMSS
jgi:nucleoside-diphosphate-sugar epimerase